jgi:hypothetical protein
MLCQRLQVLHDGSEVELVARAGKAPQAHALESMVGLQVCKERFAAGGAARRAGWR